MLGVVDGVRKLCVIVEEIRVEGGRPVAPPTRVAAAGAVIANPLAGRFVEDLAGLADAYCEPLGRLLAEQALEALGAGDEAEAYGKGALIGLAGEVEHGSAIIHNLRFGNLVREPVGGSSLLPSAEKRGAAGATLDLALKHKADHTVRSHHQSFEVRIPDAPRDDEIVVWVALASFGRPHARLPAFGSELAADAF
jgi:Amino acid synthesis